MKITLIRTGGFIPMTKKAEKDVSWSEEEITALVEEIKVENTNPQTRDNTSYHLHYNAETFSIDWEKIPAKYIKTFEALKDKLAIVSQK